MNSPPNFDDQRAHGAILNFFLRAYGQPKRPKSVQLAIRSVGRAVVSLAEIEISALEEKDIGPIADELFELATQKTQEVKRTERFELTADSGSPPPFIFQVHYKAPTRASKALPPRQGGVRGGDSAMMEGGYAPETMAGMTGMEVGDADMPIDGEFDNGNMNGGAGGYYPHEFAMPGTDAPVRHQGAAFALQAFKGFRDLHRTSLQGFKFQIASLMRQVVHQQKVIEGYERMHEEMVLARENALSQQAERDRLRSASEREDAYRSTALVSLLSAAPELLERVTGKPLGDEQKALFHSLAQAHLRAIRKRQRFSR